MKLTRTETTLFNSDDDVFINYISEAKSFLYFIFSHQENSSIELNVYLVKLFFTAKVSCFEKFQKERNRPSKNWC